MATPLGGVAPPVPLQHLNFWRVLVLIALVNVSCIGKGRRIASESKFRLEKVGGLHVIVDWFKQGQQIIGRMRSFSLHPLKRNVGP